MFCRPADSEVTIDANLAENTCTHVHKWLKNNFCSCGDKRSKRISYHTNDLEEWSPHPHHSEYDHAVGGCRNNSKRYSNQEDKEVVDDQHYVLVDQTYNLVRNRNCLGALIFSETILKVKLEGKKAHRFVLHVHSGTPLILPLSYMYTVEPPPPPPPELVEPLALPLRRGQPKG